MLVLPKVNELWNLTRQLLVQLVVGDFRLCHLVSLVTCILLQQRLHDVLQLRGMEERRPVADDTELACLPLLANAGSDGRGQAWAVAGFAELPARAESWRQCRFDSVAGCLSSAEPGSRWAMLEQRFC